METPKKKRGRPRNVKDQKALDNKVLEDFVKSNQTAVQDQNKKDYKDQNEIHYAALEKIIDAEKLYFAKLKIAGKEYHAEAATLEDAILNLKPLVKKGVGILTVKHGDKEIQKILSGPMTFKLFSVVSRLSREIAFKNLKTLFVL